VKRVPASWLERMLASWLERMLERMDKPESSARSRVGERELDIEKMAKLLDLI
jgi:hypothetical protein